MCWRLTRTQGHAGTSCHTLLPDRELTASVDGIYLPMPPSWTIYHVSISIHSIEPSNISSFPKILTEILDHEVIHTSTGEADLPFRNVVNSKREWLSGSSPLPYLPCRISIPVHRVISIGAVLPSAACESFKEDSDQPTIGRMCKRLPRPSTSKIRLCHLVWSRKRRHVSILNVLSTSVDLNGGLPWVPGPHAQGCTVRTIRAS